MSYFKTEHPFVPAEFTRSDLILTTVLFGFLLGFGYFVIYHAVLETRRTRRFNTYIILCWFIIVASFSESVVSWLFLDSVIKPGFWVFFFIALFWAIQTNCILQVIINRICILLHSGQKQRRIKYTIAFLATLINISVFCIWIPDRLQISHTWHELNFIWDRIEKCLFLILDATLNVYFIYIVQTRLISHGLTKYNALLRFNKVIIVVSIALDIILIALMQLKNDLAYVQFQSLAYLIKVEIEMTTSRLIVKVATSTGLIIEPDYDTSSQGVSGTSGIVVGSAGRKIPMQVQVRTQVVTDQRDNEEIGVDLEMANRRSSMKGSLDDAPSDSENKVQMDVLSR